MLTAQKHVQGLRNELAKARGESDKLFSLISPAGLYARPIAERHRLVFYLGHLEAFDWNLMARRGMSAPDFSCGVRQAVRTWHRSSAWPGAPGFPERLAGTKGNRTVRGKNARVDRFAYGRSRSLAAADGDRTSTHARRGHSRICCTSFRTGRSWGRRKPPSERRPASVNPPANPMVGIEAASVTLGQTRERFGWDNEHLAHEVFVPAFHVSKFKISNGQYLEFVREGGVREGAYAPHFWRRREEPVALFAECSRSSPLPLDWPVWLTWQQASGLRGLAGSCVAH